MHNRILHGLNATGQALLRSQVGQHSGDIYAVLPTQPHLRPAPARFLTCLRRRLWLPLGIASPSCPGAGCNASLDVRGFHLLACAHSGRLLARARPLERAWSQVLREAGARVREQVPVSSLNLAPSGVGADRKLDFVALGLPVYGGLPLCGDPTLRSPITAEGVAQSGAAADGSAPIRRAEYDKRRVYADLQASDRCVLLPLACTTGGKWSDTCLDLVRKLAWHKVEREPILLRQSYRNALQRRWWGLLSVALHDAVAASLDPGDVVAESAFPPMDLIDLWVRDPPPVSALGPR